MDRPDFEAVVNETIKTLPEKFQKAIEGVAVVVEPYPVSNGRIVYSLLGLYQGTPVTTWSPEYSGKLPDKISLYQMNIENYAQTPEEVPHIIRETLLHEIAHHFGFDHDRIHGMEKRWRQQRT